VLAAPYGACWRLRSALTAGFWALTAGQTIRGARLFGLIPYRIAQLSAEHLFARLCVEALLWCPAALLRNEFTSWEHLDERHCRVQISWHGLSESLVLTINAEGAPQEIRSSSQPQSIIAMPSRFQTFDGLRLPTRVRILTGDATDCFSDIELRDIRFPGPWAGSSHT
jgi:hypothetical protein